MQARDTRLRRWIIAVVSCLLLLPLSLWLLHKNPFYVPNGNVPEEYFRWNAIAHILTAAALVGLAVTSIYFISCQIPKKRLYWSAIILFGALWFVQFGMFRETWAYFSWSESEGLKVSLSGRRVFNKPLEWQVKPELNAIFNSGCISKAEGNVSVLEMTLLPWGTPIDIGTDGMTFERVVYKPCRYSKRQ